MTSPNKTKQETLEEAAENYSKITLNKGGLMSNKQINDFIAGAKWQEKKMYSEEDMKEAISYGYDIGFSANSSNKIKKQFPSEKDFFEQFKKN
jgi:hypothetical protein